jgi:hypothetical protein
MVDDLVFHELLLLGLLWLCVILVWSKNSCGFAVVVLQQPPSRSRHRIGSSGLRSAWADGNKSTLPFP